MNVSLYELCSLVGLIALIVYTLKARTTDGLLTKLHRQMDRQKLINAELEDKLLTIKKMEIQIIELDKQQKRMHQDIILRREQLEADQQRHQGLLDKQNQLNLQIQREKETMLIKEEEYKQEMSKIEQHMEFRKTQFINKMSLYNKEIEAYTEQEEALRKILSTIKEEKTALKAVQELESIQTGRLKNIEECKKLLSDLNLIEEKINEDIRKKLATINFKLGSATNTGHTGNFECQPENLVVQQAQDKIFEQLPEDVACQRVPAIIPQQSQQSQQPPQCQPYNVPIQQPQDFDLDRAMANVDTDTLF